MILTKIQNLLGKITSKIDISNDARFVYSNQEIIPAIICAIGDIILHHQSINQLRLVVMGLMQTSISRSTFWERLASKGMLKYMRIIFQTILESVVIQNSTFQEIANKLQVNSIFLVDASTIPLKDDAAEDFPSVTGQKSPAALKIHALLDVLKYSIFGLNITEGSCHDRYGIKMLGEMLVNSLLIFDLGYYDYSLFAEINCNGGFFLSRIKVDSVIIAVSTIKNSKELGLWIGKNIMNINYFMGEVIEFTGKFKINYSTNDFYRVMGFWDEDEKKYHWYCTNLKDHVKAELIYLLYSLRWQIELFFKTLKGACSLKKITSSNPIVIENLILASSIAFILGSIISNTVIENINEISNEKISDENNKKENKISNNEKEIINKENQTSKESQGSTNNKKEQKNLDNEKEITNKKNKASKGKKKKVAQTIMRIMHGFKNISTELYQCFIKSSEDALNKLKKKIHIYKDELYDPNYNSRLTTLGKIYFSLV